MASARSVVADPTSRDKILDVAEALFARRGFAGIGMREVAQRVGLGKSSLFHHFPTKLALYDEVLGRVLGRLEEALAPALSPDDAPPAERLDRWIDAVVDALAEHPTTARLALRGLFEEDEAERPAADPTAPWEPVLERLVASFQELLSHGIAAGAFRPVSVGHLTQTVIGATVYHFASSSFGEAVTGADLYSAAEVARRKKEVKRVLRAGVLASEPAEERHPIPMPGERGE